MAEERTVKGIIEAWAKEIKTGVKKDNSVWFSISCKINKQWVSQFTPDAETGKKFMEENPVGSEVELTEIKNGNYWNYKMGSWTLIKKGDGKTQNPAPQENQSTTGGGVDWDAKDRKIVRQNSLNHADNFLNYLHSSGQLADTKQDKIKEVYFKFAQECEEWVYREDAKPDEPVKDEEEVI